jgi:hypothetical protein
LRSFHREINTALTFFSLFVSRQKGNKSSNHNHAEIRNINAIVNYGSGEEPIQHKKPLPEKQIRVQLKNVRNT